MRVNQSDPFSRVDTVPAPDKQTQPVTRNPQDTDSYQGSVATPKPPVVDMKPVKEVISSVTSGLRAKFNQPGSALQKLALADESNQLSADQLKALKTELERERDAHPRLFKWFKPNKQALLRDLTAAYEKGFGFNPLRRYEYSSNTNGYHEIESQYRAFAIKLLHSGADVSGYPVRESDGNIDQNVLLNLEINQRKTLLNKMISKNQTSFLSLIKYMTQEEKNHYLKRAVGNIRYLDSAIQLIQNGADASVLSDESLLANSDLLKAALSKMTQERKDALLKMAGQRLGSNFYEVYEKKIYESYALDLINSGADASVLSDEALLANPDLLKAALSKMIQERKNALLMKGDISRTAIDTLIENGADASLLSNESLLANSKFLKAALSNMAQERKDALLKMAGQKLGFGYSFYREDDKSRALDLIESGADASVLSDDALLANPDLLKAALPKLTQDRKDALLKRAKNRKDIDSLIESGADASVLSDDALLANPDLLEAVLLNMTQARKDALLDKAVSNVVSNLPINNKVLVLLVRANPNWSALPMLTEDNIRALLKQVSPTGIERPLLLKALAGPVAHKTEAPPTKAEIDESLLDLKGLFDVPSEQPDIDGAFLKQLKDKSLSNLLDDYENFKIARGLPENLAPQNLAEMLSNIRAIISEKIKLLSPEEKTALKSEIARFKTTSSVAQFSSAVQSAHRRGITGKGVKVAVLEPMREADEGKSIGKTARVAGVGQREDSSHGYHVTGIVQQLTPDSPIQVQWGNLRLGGVRVINCSFGSGTQNETSPNLLGAFNSGKLVIKSAGNDGGALDLSPTDPKRDNDQNYLTDLPDDQKARMILTGNLEAGNIPAPSSTRPGDNPKLQDHFLWTLGSDVLSLTGQDEVGRRTGTSMSAPVVTGAAALVQSFWPDATPEQVKECLMESADRDFWIHQPNMSIHVVAPDRLGELKVSTDGTEATWPFDKTIFGKGILNVRRALEYAELKKGHPELNSAQICRILEHREEKAATKIQRLFRRSRVGTAQKESEVLSSNDEASKK